MGDIRIFYKSIYGEKKLSTNFRVCEFSCKDGADIIPIDMELVGVLQDVRDHFKVPVAINSAYRTPEKVYAYLTEKYPGKYGIGKYPTFTHIDTRLNKARW